MKGRRNKGLLQSTIGHNAAQPSRKAVKQKERAFYSEPITRCKFSVLRMIFFQPEEVHNMEFGAEKWHYT